MILIRDEEAVGSNPATPTKESAGQGPSTEGPSPSHERSSSAGGSEKAAKDRSTRPSRSLVECVYRSSVVDVCSCPITFATSLSGTPSETSHVAYECRKSWNRSPIGRPALCSEGFQTRARKVPRLSAAPVRATKIRSSSPTSYAFACSVSAWTTNGGSGTERRPA